MSHSSQSNRTQSEAIEPVVHLPKRKMMGGFDDTFLVVFIFRGRGRVTIAIKKESRVRVRKLESWAEMGPKFRPNFWPNFRPKLA